MTKTVDTRIQTKRDSSTNWETNNPILLDGEEILVNTTDGEVRRKIGDGTTSYNNLPFTDESIKTLIDTKSNSILDQAKSYTDSTVQRTVNPLPTTVSYSRPTKVDCISGMQFIVYASGAGIMELTLGEAIYSIELESINDIRWFLWVQTSRGDSGEEDAVWAGSLISPNGYREYLVTGQEVTEIGINWTPTGTYAGSISWVVITIV